MTLNQLLKNPRKKKIHKKKNKALMKSPQRSGVCLKVLKTTPRKPNSAQRSIAKIKLTNKKEIIAYIPGIGHSYQIHSKVLIKGGIVKDLPGVRYRIIRGGKYGMEVKNRKKSRSKYGVKLKK